jgi:AraC family transcriptional regulator
VIDPSNIWYGQNGLGHPANSRVPWSVSTTFDDAPLPLHDLGDLIVHQSDCPGFKGLQVRLCNLPSRGRLTTIDSLEAYQFAFRVQGNKGTQLRVSALGRASRQSYADDLLLIPPGVRAQVEWMKSVGRLAIFSLTPSFIGNIADQIDLPAPFLGRLPLSFSIDRRFGELCELLMDESEGNCLNGPVYFEALARALVGSMLGKMRDRELPRRMRPHIPQRIRETIQRLEGDFAERISVTDLARIASLSVDYFARAFREATGSTPHQYLLRVRLRRARAMMTQDTQRMSMAEIALTCGFADQAHFCRHFRRFFGRTPSAFLHESRSVRQRPPAGTFSAALSGSTKAF